MSRASHISAFPAMSTTVNIASVGIAGDEHQRAMEAIEADARDWEERFSRFRATSLLSRVNAAAGRWVAVDTPFLDLLETARQAVVATGGRFNPAILPALVASGYDRTIDDVRRGAITGAAPAASVPLDAWADVGINRSGMRVRLPEGMQVDFGGIAKGALADRLAGRFGHWPGGAIGIGGDTFLWGLSPDGDAWRVGVEHPLDPDQDIAVVAVPAGVAMAIATSSRTKRAWATGHGDAHHLIDPETGAPAQTSLLTVTVCASTTTIAEVVTKNLMVASAHGALAPGMLLDASWALTITDTLDVARITKEAA